MLHCAQFLPPHLPSSTAVPLLPPRRPRPRPQTLVQRAMQPPRRRLLLFPFFQFGWGAGSERATHSPTPFYFLAAFTPTPRTVSITLLLAPPPHVAGRRKNIYIYLFLRGLRLPTPFLLLSPCSLLSATLLSASTFEIFSVSRTFFLFLISPASFSFLLPSTTSYRAAAPRVRETDRERERVENDKTDREGKWECEGRGVERGKGSKRRRLLRRRRRRRRRRPR